MSDKERIPAHIRLGYQFGHLHKGWSLRDYLVYPVEHEDGFETCAIHGSQGSGKSSRALQYGAWIKEKELTLKLGRAPTERELWESVLATLCFTPGDFVAALESVEGTERLTLLIWDDILLNFTSSAFKVDIAMYSAVDACFAVVRKKLGVCILTLPNLTRLGKCIKDNVSLECYVGRNQLEQVRRVYRLPGTRAIDSNLFKPILEQPHTFNLYKVPAWAWKLYDEKRVEIANRALATLKGVSDLAELDGYMPILDASKWLKDRHVNWGVSTLQQNISRGVIRGQKVQGTLCVCLEDLEKVVEIEGHPKGV